MVRKLKPHKRPNRTKDSINMAGLQPNSAPDTDGTTVPLTAKVEPELKAWVQQYSSDSKKSVSQIVREALRLYRAETEKDDLE